MLSQEQLQEIESDVRVFIKHRFDLGDAIKIVRESLGDEVEDALRERLQEFAEVPDKTYQS